MRELKYIMIHCTATPEGREVTRKDIENWHIKGRGWSRVGYSDMIMLDGGLVNLIDYDQNSTIDRFEISNGAKGYNGVTRHVVYVGGLDKEMSTKDTRTEGQLKSLETYVKYMVLRHPEIRVIGHNQVSSKDCPSFNVKEWCWEIGLNDKNIGL